jgi:uroporphyrinogen decarboxylase
MALMTHTERVMATLAGREADRPPISMWRHFFDRETRPDTLAQALIEFQERFDWDFMKVNPRASYHVEGWGVKVAYHGAEHPRVTGTPVTSPEDWLKLKVLPLDTGVLKEHLDSLEIVARGLKGQIPFLMTVFTPVAIAGRMTPTEDMFMQHLREHTKTVQYALDVITETFTRFSKACLERGASGLFYATTAFATSDRISADEYRSLVMPYDLKLLKALPAAEFHLLHVCRDNNLLPLFTDYPVHAINWDPLGHGNLSLAEGRELLGGKVVVGGIPHQDELVNSRPEQLAQRVRELRASMGKEGWMLGTGCTFPPETPERNLAAIRKAAEAG